MIIDITATTVLYTIRACMHAWVDRDRNIQVTSGVTFYYRGTRREHETQTDINHFPENCFQLIVVYL